ncbi:hypothetical protein UQ33_27855, partial [Escherichia coli]
LSLHCFSGGEGEMVVRGRLRWVEVRRTSEPFGSEFKVSTGGRNEVFWDWLSREADLIDCRWLFLFRSE